MWMLKTFLILIFCEIVISNDLSLSNAEFGLDILKKLCTPTNTKNIVFSPYSLFTALSMVRVGAQGPTGQQLGEALHVASFEVSELNNKSDVVGKSLKEDNVKKYISVANKIYVDDNFSILKNYSTQIKTYYNGEAEKIDFSNSNSYKKINHWVFTKTNKMIKNFILPKGISKDTKMILVNAINFKANWMVRFMHNETKMAPFKISPDKTINLKMMNSEMRILYGYNDAFTAIQLPYTGDRLNMYILLPILQSANSVASSANSVASGNLAQLLNSLNSSILSDPKKFLDMQNMTVKISIPKFKIDFSKSMSEPLKALGVVDMFSEAKANLSGISDLLFVKDVFHRAVMHVDEAGTKAAAATKVTFLTRSKPIILSFLADRPFVFFIHDQQLSTVLFMGVYMGN